VVFIEIGLIFVWGFCTVGLLFFGG